MPRLLRLLLGGVLAIAMGVPAGAVTGSSVVGAQSSPSSGVNDWTCRPSAAHPNPVVFLHGFGALDVPGPHPYITQYLAGRGHCVFHKVYGRAFPVTGSLLGLQPVGGYQHIDTSATEITQFIDQVLSATGASEVDIVGHSEGGFLGLYIPKARGYGDRIDAVVALDPPTPGVNPTYGLLSLGDPGLRDLLVLVAQLFGCGACEDLLVGGPAVQALNEPPVTVPGVAYTIIGTRGGNPIRFGPPSHPFVYEPGVDNFYVQDVCPNDPVGHIGMVSDPVVVQMVANALDPANAQPVDCSVGGPPI